MIGSAARADGAVHSSPDSVSAATRARMVNRCSLSQCFIAFERWYDTEGGIYLEQLAIASTGKRVTSGTVPGAVATGPGTVPGAVATGPGTVPGAVATGRL